MFSGEDEVDMLGIGDLFVYVYIYTFMHIFGIIWKRKRTPSEVQQDDSL